MYVCIINLLLFRHGSCFLLLYITICDQQRICRTYRKQGFFKKNTKIMVNSQQIGLFGFQERNEGFWRMATRRQLQILVYMLIIINTKNIPRIALMGKKIGSTHLVKESEIKVFKNEQELRNYMSQRNDNEYQLWCNACEKILIAKCKYCDSKIGWLIKSDLSFQLLHFDGEHSHKEMQKVQKTKRINKGARDFTRTDNNNKEKKLQYYPIQLLLGNPQNAEEIIIKQHMILKLAKDLTYPLGKAYDLLVKAKRRLESFKVRKNRMNQKGQVKIQEQDNYIKEGKMGEEKREQKREEKGEEKREERGEKKGEEKGGRKGGEKGEERGEKKGKEKGEKKEEQKQKERPVLPLIPKPLYQQQNRLIFGSPNPAFCLLQKNNNQRDNNQQPRDDQKDNNPLNQHQGDNNQEEPKPMNRNQKLSTRKFSQKQDQPKND